MTTDEYAKRCRGLSILKQDFRFIIQKKQTDCSETFGGIFRKIVVVPSNFNKTSSA